MDPFLRFMLRCDEHPYISLFPSGSVRVFRFRRRKKFKIKSVELLKIYKFREKLKILLSKIIIFCTKPGDILHITLYCTFSHLLSVLKWGRTKGFRMNQSSGSEDEKVKN